MRTAAILAALLLAPAASATVLADWSLEEVAARADRVDVGVVVAREALHVKGEIFTDLTLRVERSLRGAARETLRLRQLGGTLGGETVELVGDAKLPVGSRVLLFTYLHKDGSRYLVGMCLGAYLVDEGRLVQDVRVPLVRAGAMRPPPGRVTTTMERVERAVRP